jgi:hypothetical protein
VTTLRNRESGGKIFLKASAREANPLSFSRDIKFSFMPAQMKIAIFISVISVA